MMPRRLAAENHSAEPDVLRRIGQERHEPCPLQRDGQATLMVGARPGLAARLDLRAVGQVPPETAHVLVVDVIDLVDAELADAAPGG